LAFINSDACKLCRKCVTECPTNSILEIGFPERKLKVEKKEEGGNLVESNKKDVGNE